MFDAYYSDIACNSYIIWNNNNEGFIIDPTANIGDVFLKHIDRLGVTIKGVLITHGHYDHISSLESICKNYNDCPVYINVNDEDLLSNPKLNLSFHDNSYCGHLLTYVPKNLILLNDGEEFDCCGFKIKLIHTPFHTHGSSCYYLSSENMLFTGDTLFFSSIGRNDFPTGNGKLINESLDKIKNFPRNTKIYPGHGISSTLDRELKYNPYLRNNYN